jgi:hypothetical protein
VGLHGEIYHFDGSTWSLNTTTAQGSYLRSVDMFSATDGWTVGENGRIYHFSD